MTLPVPDCVSFMLRVKRPEARRRNATRSRWLGSMLAWTLKTNPETSLSDGLISRSLAACGRGGGACWAKAASKSLTAKFFSAEPKNTGDRWPSR